MSLISQMLKNREPELLDRKDGHWYKSRSGNQYPSISTILSATVSDEKKNNLEAWRRNEPAHQYIFAQAQKMGAQTHKIIENYLCNNQSIKNMSFEKFDLLPKAHFDNLKPYLDNVSDSVHRATDVL